MAIKLKDPTDQLTTLQHVQLIRRNISGKRVEIASRSLVTKIPRLSHKGSNTSKAQACWQYFYTAAVLCFFHELRGITALMQLLYDIYYEYDFSWKSYVINMSDRVDGRRTFSTKACAVFTHPKKSSTRFGQAGRRAFLAATFICLSLVLYNGSLYTYI